MFNTYEFIYNDIPSSMYGLFICDFDGNSNENVSFGNKADIIERRVNGRVSPLHYGVDYNKEPLSFKLIFASYRELDRWDLQEVARWLTGYSDYKWLHIEQSDMDNLFYHCLITNLTPLHVGWAPYAFEATVRCDCPYAYGCKKELPVIIDDPWDIFQFSVDNDGTARVGCRPVMTLSKSPDSSSIAIIVRNSASSSGGIGFSEMPSSVSTITINNKNQIIETNDASLDIYKYLRGDFIELSPGKNDFSCMGVSQLTIEWQEYYNTGA